MFKSLLNKNLVPIILLCFFATTIYFFFWTGEILLANKIIGFVPDGVSYTGVLGCTTDTWMQPVMSFIGIPIATTIILSGFFLSRKAFRTNNTKLMLFASFLFYPVASGLANKILNSFTGHPLRYLEGKTFYENQQVFLFGNIYNFHLAQFAFDTIATLIYLYLAYLIIFKYWDKTLRLQYFTFGLVFCFLGKAFWYLLLGPILFPYS